MSRLICESCDHGYPTTSASCPWCRCSSQMAHTTHDYSCFDTECYKDYWLCMFSTGEVFQMFDGHALDIQGLRRALSKYTCVSFNGINYDMPIIALALAGYGNAQLKAASDAIIVQGVHHWDLLKQYGVQPLDWVDHIDLIEVAPGQGSLKAYGGKMHSRKLQDLPIPPDASIQWYDRPFLREYCVNDLATTEDLYRTFPTQLQLREEMSEEYGIDLRSKSDAQIAEAVMKKLLPFKVEVPYIAPGTQFNYRPPEWLKFTTPYLSGVLSDMCAAPYSITVSGGVSPAFHNHYVDWGADQERLDPHGIFVKRPDGWQQRLIRIGDTEYAMGSGGLHSTESSVVRVSDGEYVISDHDVRGYYPSSILLLDIYPRQIGPTFLEHYRGWKVGRDQDKAKSEDTSLPKDVRMQYKKKANSKKTLTNGTFGKLGSKWSIFYAPSEMIQVTVTGQFALLMLIEALESAGIPVVSANTDGIVVRCHRSMEWVRDNIISWWERATGYETEHAYYRMLASRDINSYVAIKTDGTPKLKGAFAPAEPGPSGWPNPTGQICVNAVVKYLQDGTPLAHTIESCTDIRQFVYVRQVKGGGSYCPDGVLSRKATQKYMRERLGLPDASKEQLLAAWGEACDREVESRRYLGKIVRWYYAAGNNGAIVTPSGGLVPRTDGCRPLMELPDELPTDIDYEWYITEAKSLLADIGITASDS